VLNKKMIESLNVQIGKEIYSGYLYLSISAQCEHQGLKGFANWFMVQYQEEMEHAMRLYQYILGQGGTVRLPAIAQPPDDFASPLEMFEKTLAHEQTVTQSINGLMDEAVQAKDHASQIFLQWFVTEQIEEEANPAEIISQLRLVGTDGNGLFMIDKELSTRVFVSQLGGQAGSQPA
jgi:ferritin